MDQPPDSLASSEEASGASGSTGRASLWTWVQERINLALYRPAPAQGVDVSRLAGREGIYYVLKAPDASRYLKLSDRDYFLWSQMDGQRTVKDLVVAYFVEYGAFAFERVTQLVLELRSGGFFADRSLHVLTHVQTELESRELSSRGQRLMAAFVHHEIAIPGIDVILERLYRHTSWLFLWPAQLFLLLVILVGMFLFVDLFLGGQVPLLTVGESYWLGLLALLGIQVLIIISHELAHGLTTKHYGRQIRRGGFLIYYGYPAFFVDTMDMWLADRRSRIAVSWAGPHSGLVVGGLAAIMMRAFPESPLVPWMYKTSFLAYLTVFINLNPLLELDGYLILIDLLDIPMLRQRAFGFVRQQILNELRDVWRKWRAGQPDWSSGFTREERLLAIFGLLAGAYTLYSAWIAALFWRTQIATALTDLWNRPGWLSKLLLTLVISGIIIPVGVALLAKVLSWGRRAWLWLARRGFFAQDRNVNLFLLVLATLLTLGPVGLNDPWWSGYLALMPPLLLALAAGVLVNIALRYRGAEFQRFFWALLAAVGILCLAAILRLLVYLGELAAPWVYDVERLTALPLVMAGFFGLSGVDLRKGRSWERVSMVGCILLAGLLAVPVARWTAADPFARAFIGVSAPYLTLIFLATSLPNLAGSFGTRFFGPWMALATAAVLTGAIALVRILPNGMEPDSDLDRWMALVLAVIWAYGVSLYALAGRRSRFERVEWDALSLISEEQRLRQAFMRFYASLFDSFKQTFGLRRAQAVDDELDVIAVTSDWDIDIDGGRIRDELDLSRITLRQQAERYREVLDRTVDLMDNFCGHFFIKRAAQAAYDSLSWPEREVFGRYVLQSTRWGAAVAAHFSTDRDARWQMVRLLPLFAHCDERALSLIVAGFSSQRVPAGAVIARQGDSVDRFILIQSGEVEAWRQDDQTGVSRLVTELRRGSSLGDQAFFNVGRFEATYRASTPGEILVLDTGTCDRLLRSGVALATRVGASLEIVRLLGGMPLFSHLSPQQLGNVAGRLRRQRTLGTQIVAHMGSERHSLFIVFDGTVEALADDSNGNKTIAHEYSPGEHFGEYALFEDTPYQFTYRTRGPATLLTLDESTFDALVTESERMARYVEQIGSGRLLMKPTSRRRQRSV